jgi:hypothetical protein
MSPFRHENGKRIPIESWDSHVDRVIREAQVRGEFDNLPGEGKPLDLEDNPFAGEWQSAYRIARNAGAAPLWVILDREITADRAALRELGERTSRYLTAEAQRLRRERVAAGEAGGASAERPAVSRRWPGRWWRRLLYGARGRCADRSLLRASTMADLEAQRRRARRLYLKRAQEIDEKIDQFNTQRPRNLSWLEKPRLSQGRAAEDFDTICPPLPA